MIVWSERAYLIGHRFDSGASGVTDIEGRKHFLPFFVLRESTFDEWWAEYCAENGPGTKSQARRKIGSAYFYEVSID